MRMFDLGGKVAVVSGGNGGIGLGIAAGLVEAGASVLLAGRNVAKGERAARELGERAAFSVGDVTRKAACEALVAEAVARFGRLDVVVNNAGTTVRKPPQAVTEAEWHHVIDTNLTSAFLLSQAAYPELVRAGGGKIINIGSLASIFGMPHNVPYAASKGGIVQMTRGMATAWAANNIQVNAILPGWIETEMTANAFGNPKFAGNVLPRIPERRWGVGADFGPLAVYLASDATRYTTGRDFVIDGGYTLF